MKPYIVLGTYNPTSWRAWKIGRDLTRLVKEKGLEPINDIHHRHQSRAAWHNASLVAYVRRRTVRNPKASGWHQDGDLVAGSQMDNCIVTWSSNTPTEFKVGTTVYRPNKREVVLFRNLSCLHRRPPSCPRVRWLFRQRVEAPTHITLP